MINNFYLNKKLVFFIIFLFCFEAFSQNKVESFKKLSETEPDKALASWQAVYDKSDEEDKVRTLLFVAQAYMLKRDLKKAFLFIEKAEKGANTLKNSLLKSETLLYKSGIYTAMSLYDEGEKYALQGLESVKKVDSKKGNVIEGDLNYLLVTIRTISGKEKNPIPFYKKALNLYLDSDLPEDEKSRRVITTMYNLGTIYYDKNEIDSAEFYFKNILLSTVLSENPYIEAVSYERNGEIHYQKNNLDEALISLNKATPSLKNFNDPNLATNYSLLSVIYEKKGDQKKSFEYKNLENDFRNSMSVSQRESLVEAFTSLEANRKNIEKTAKNRMFFLWGLGAFSVLVIISFYIYFNRRKAKQKQLYQQIISKLELKFNEKTFENEIENRPVQELNEISKGSTLTETTEQELLKKLKNFEDSEKYTNPKLSLSLLATHLGTNTNYLSEVINTNKGKNYNNYINELRINYICSKILNDPLYRKYKVSYLAEKCGFTSYSSFTTVFKNINGISPSIFIKQVEQSIKEK